MCPAISPSNPSSSEVAAEGELIENGSESAVIGVDDEYREGTFEFGKGESPFMDMECGTCENQIQKPLGLRGPHQPSAEDVAFHNLTHFPYRSWCKHCVACKRTNTIHKSVTTER